MSQDPALGQLLIRALPDDILARPQFASSFPARFSGQMHLILRNMESTGIGREKAQNAQNQRANPDCIGNVVRFSAIWCDPARISIAGIVRNAFAFVRVWHRGLDNGSPIFITTHEADVWMRLRCPRFEVKHSDIILCVLYLA